MDVVIKRRFMRIIAIVLTSLLLVGCACLKKKEPAKLQVVNVLDRDLFDDCHIKVRLTCLLSS